MLKIDIEGTPKEIADLAGEAQNRQKIDLKEIFAKQMNCLSEASKMCLNRYESLETLPALTAAMISLAKL